MSMSWVSAGILAAYLLLPSMWAAAGEADSEMAMHRLNRRETDWKMLVLRYHGLRQQKQLGAMPDPMIYNRQFAACYPGTREAALAQQAIMNHYYEQKDFPEFLAAAEELCRNDFEYGRPEALDRLVTFINTQKDAGVLRDRAARLVLEHCEGYGAPVRALANEFLDKQRTPFADALAVARRAGAAEPMAMAVLAMFMDDSAERRDAFAALYGEEWLPPLTAERARQNPECAAAFAEVVEHIKAGRHDEALANLREWKRFSPWVSDPFVKKLYYDHTQAMDDSTAWRYAEAVMSFALPGEPRKTWWNGVINGRPASFLPENAGAVTPVMEAYFGYRPGLGEIYFQSRFLENRQFPNLPAMARLTLAAGLRDKAAWLLFLAARSIWDTDKAAARRCLEEAVQAAPDSAGAVQAAWWLDRMSGRVSFDAGASPRAPEFLRAEDFRPAPFPAFAGEDVPAATATRAPRLPEAVDFDDFEAWIPETLPASRVFPLRRVSTVKNIQVQAADGLHFTLELADRDGKVLLLLERAWPFEILSNKSTYQPAGEHRLEFAPVDGVAMVRIVILDRTAPTDGIQSLRAAAPPHPLRAFFQGEEVPLAAGIRSLLLTYDANEPVHTIVYRSGNEGWRVTPYMRWQNPWTSHNRRGNTTLFFLGGDTLEVEAVRGGILHFVLDSGNPIRWGKKAGGKERHILAAPARYGLGRLEIRTSAFPSKDGEHVPDTAQVLSLSVAGKARALPGAEFKIDGRWEKFVPGTRIAVPDGATDWRGVICFDSSGAAGEKAAEVNRFDARAQNDASPPRTPGANALPSMNAALPVAAPEDCADWIKRRRPAIVYSKTGTEAEYRIAKALAEKSGGYLVSDDAGLNNADYRGPFLAIGTPLHNRFCRQVAARYGLWRSAEFLNSEQGFILRVPEFGEEEEFYCVTGQTAAVIAAATDLLAKATPHQAAAPFRLFGQNLFERLMPWQLHPEAPALESLSLTAARHDRRNAAFGIAFEQPAQTFRVRAGQLRDGDAVLAAPEVRFVGFHEYIDFYGDLHQPDFLFPAPRLPIAANTAQLVLLTCRIPANTPPGRYQGSVEVEVDGTKQTLPFALDVMAGTLRPGILDFNDYAVMPYYYHHTERMRRDRLNLLRNQADHGISMVIPRVWLERRPAFGEGGASRFDFGFVDEYVEDADRVYAEADYPPPLIFFSLPDGKLKTLAQGEKRPYAEVAAEYARALKDHLAASPKLEKRFYCSLGDEVSSVLDRWLEEAAIYSEAGLKLFVTHADPRMEPVVDAWVPNYAHQLYDTPYLAEALREGKKRAWWYACAGGGPNTRFTGQPVDFLPQYWLTAKWGLDGTLSNAAMHTTAWGHPVPYRVEHGSDTRILYLPDGAVFDTLRREFEAEGIRDALLLYPLRDHPEIRADLARTVPSKWQYSRRPGDYDAVREKAYSLLN